MCSTDHIEHINTRAIIAVFMSSRKFSKPHKTKLLTTLAISAFVLVFLLQLIPFANATVETDFMTMLNNERASLGKAPLAVNPSLSNAAYLHSKDMGDNNYFSHTSLDGRTFDQRIVAAGYTGWTSLGENIAMAYGSPDATQVYSMWKNSAGHYANMMGDFNEAGLGIYSIRGYNYYTLDLGKRSNPIPPPPAPAADFSFSTSTATVNLQVGTSTTATLTVSSLNGFVGTVDVTLAASSGLTATLNPTSLAVTSASSKTSALTITVPASIAVGTYTITLTAKSGALTHAITITVSVQAAPQTSTAPSEPLNLRAIATDTKVTLSWSAPLNNGGSTITNYRVYRRTSSNAETLIATVGNSLGYVDTSVLNGQTYVYRVTAVNAVGESAKSIEASATPVVSNVKTLNVAVTTNSPSYVRGSYGTILIRVTDGATGKVLSGASVQIQFYTPTGTLAANGVFSTGSRGTLQVWFGLGTALPTGTYTIKVTVSLAGYQSKTTQTSFGVV